jgi:hypothetical protein
MPASSYDPLQPTGAQRSAAAGDAHGASRGEAHRIIADALPPLLASVLPPDQLELVRQRLLQLLEPEHPRLTKRDGLGALGICLLSFLSTFPIVIPFILIGESIGAAPLQCDRDRNATRVRLCVRTLRRVSTVGNGPLDGRHRCGAGRRRDRSGRPAWRPRTAVSAGTWRVLPASLHLACVPRPRRRT